MVETVFMRLVATAGIVGIGVAIAAIMYSQKSQGWLIGFVVSVVLGGAGRFPLVLTAPLTAAAAALWAARPPSGTMISVRAPSITSTPPRFLPGCRG